MDLIDRAEVLDALNEQIEQCDRALNSFDISMKDEYAVKVERASLVAFRETLKYIPSAQPEQRWETCFDCPLSNGCPKIRGCTNDQAEQYASGIPDDCPLSVQPERKTGRWIYNSPVTMKCEQCGYVIKDWEWNKANYCAGCGADMIGEQNAVD